MIVACTRCPDHYDDQSHWTLCPHASRLPRDHELERRLVRWDDAMRGVAITPLDEVDG